MTKPIYNLIGRLSIYGIALAVTYKLGTQAGANKQFDEMAFHAIHQSEWPTSWLIAQEQVLKWMPVLEPRKGSLSPEISSLLSQSAPDPVLQIDDGHADELQALRKSIRELVEQHRQTAEPDAVPSSDSRLPVSGPDKPDGASVCHPIQ